jgi:quercetin dioxygenase-like cupin family protein
LYVTDGIGLVARRGTQPQQIRPGDVVYIEPGEEHWHGATADRFMAHVAIQEADDAGEVVTWLEHVTDDEYGA